MRLDRLYLVGVVAPLAYIPVLIIVIASLRMPFWADALLATVISLPFVLGFAFAMFRIVAGMNAELVRREARFRSLLESAPDAIVIVDRRGEIVIVNEEAERIFGYGAGEMPGISVERLLPERYRGGHPGLRAAYNADPQTRTMGSGRDLVALRKDGREFPVEISLSPLQADEGLLVTSVIRDVTERRHLAEERERLLAEAETEQDRQRIGMELHDGVIQSIYAVGLNLEAAAEDVTSQPAEARGRINRAIDQLNDTIGDIRSYIFALRPARYAGDLRESLANILQEFRVNSLTEATLEVDDDVPDLGEEVDGVLFAITREALNNIRKHARARTVGVRLRRTGEGVRLTVEDDGVGFDAATHQGEEHRGLRNMASRAEAAVGTLRVDAAPGKGTTVVVDLPVVAAGTGERP